MRLATGTRLGPYEILAPLGAGGMGEVYKARDTRLDRAVAVKVIATDLSASPEQRQRFEREARTVSQLSHPHICALYDVGQHEGRDYLVMELVEGETLAHRLSAGPLPLELCLKYGREMADALDKAHRSGIVHRDLKPANVMITKAGVKLLDFGLAKAVMPLSPAPMSVDTIAASPVLTARGVITGTVQYMAPELLEGRQADARSDIFALGAVIYEMATGTMVFRTARRPLAPPELDMVVRTCLANDPDDRWQSAGDIALHLRWIAETAGAKPVEGRRQMRAWLPWSIAALAVIAAAALLLRPKAPASAIPAAVRFALPPPAGGVFYENFENTGLSVSPDGTRIAFTGRAATGPLQIWLRGIAELDAKPLPGTENARSLFWSPDGRSLAFFTATKLRRMDLNGGAPLSVCDVRDGIGFAGTWGADDQILFTSIEGEAIYRVAAGGGGTPEPVLKPDRSRQEGRLNWPFFLPDGVRFLYLQRRLDGSGHLMIAEPGRAAREVRPMQSNAQYVAPGYLVFALEGSLVGQRFDAQRGTIVGATFSIAEPVNYFLTTTVARFSSSPAGTLVYAAQDDKQRLAWFDRTGREVGGVGETGRYQRPRLSPDGQQLTFGRIRAGAFDVWETDLKRQIETRLTFGESSENPGPWMPGGRSVFFDADIGAPPRIFRKDLISGREEPFLVASGTLQSPQDVSPDGRTLLYTQRGAGGDHIWMAAIDGSSAPALIGNPAYEEGDVRFSPDGRHFSFYSNASGQFEVYMSPFPPTGERVRISTGGGVSARWSRSGRALYYASDDGHLMTVPIEAGASPRVGMPVSLFEMKPRWFGFDVSPDERFLAIVPIARSNGQPLTVVLNWTAEVRN